ncbi:CubicO group peptidase, beta-lactamase class C family [Butyrivibrio hungatei DSM 14810]|uniref:CubicO group peptidase, beta-lactamase class C family n=1 Tax=Butyrivibrio hungatei DSM 14810 TaxID=1121132 RepID=A0A1M7SEL3_9FIRM|nr:serine hydrolase domain-containing protein [Butyrivibrio hungatei]SHN56884.1 CubicO group peptidase, beta-lactamase class C family [Butyrivibrio hungatei DSM 14810]
MRDKLALIQKCMDRAVEERELAGVSALLIQDGTEKFFLKSGYADEEDKVPIERNTIFHLYSQSKPITAAAMMLLVQDGIVDLCEPVGKYIDSFNDQEYLDENGKKHKVPEDKKMRIFELMNMTSGLVYPGVNSEAEKETGVLFDELIDRLSSDNQMSTLEFAEKLGKLPLNFLPGSHWQYGTSADILGAVIEKASGMKFSEFLKERLFDPLEMVDTAFFVLDEKKPRLAHAYQAKGNDLEEYKGNNLGIRNNGGVNAFESGGAGLFSTLDDYSHFARMLMDDGVYRGKVILTESAVKFLTTGKLLEYQQRDLWNWRGLEGHTYGNLMRVMDDPKQALILGNKGEYGWDGWLGTYFMNDPSTKTTFLMMTQKADYGTGHVTRRIRNIFM